MEREKIIGFIDDSYTYCGRRRITTGCLPYNMQFAGYYGDTLDEHTIARELTKAVAAHNANAAEFKALKDIFLGKQSILNRPKAERSVNNKVVVNYAQAFTRDITGYTYGGGVQYVARDADNQKAVEVLNKFVRSESKGALMKSVGDNQSIGGRGYLGVFPDMLIKNNVPFELVDYDPCDTEVVYSAYNKSVPVFAWTRYATTKDGEDAYVYSVWTNERQYTLVSGDANDIAYDSLVTSSFNIGGKSVALPYKPHLLGEIPIVEYQNNQFCIGDWECAISMFNAINDLASDSINDVEQTVMSYLALFGVDVENTDWEQVKKDRILVFNGVPGITQDAKFITSQLDGTSANMLRAYLEEALKFVVGIPDRDTGTAGSDTGISAEVRTGSGDIEIVASNKCMYTTMAERRTLRIILNILKRSEKVADLFRNIDESDIDVEIPRSKTDNLQTKVQSGQILYSMGISKSDVAKVMDLNTDTTGLVSRWGEAPESAGNNGGGNIGKEPVIGGTAE